MGTYCLEDIEQNGKIRKVNTGSTIRMFMWNEIIVKGFFKWSCVFLNIIVITDKRSGRGWDHFCGLWLIWSQASLICVIRKGKWCESEQSFIVRAPQICLWYMSWTLFIGWQLFRVKCQLCIISISFPNSSNIMKN